MAGAGGTRRRHGGVYVQTRGGRSSRMEDTARTGAVTTEHPALRHVSLSLFRVTRLLHIRSATLPAALSHQTFERSGRFRGVRGDIEWCRNSRHRRLGITNGFDTLTDCRIGMNERMNKARPSSRDSASFRNVRFYVYLLKLLHPIRCKIVVLTITFVCNFYIPMGTEELKACR
jgi:hypothetical protein